MQALVVTAGLTSRCVAAGLEVDLPVLAGELANQKVELATVAAARARDNRVPLESPRVCGADLRERQRLVRRRVAADVQLRRRVGAPDRPRNVEVLAAGLGSHYWDCRY